MKGADDVVVTLPWRFTTSATWRPARYNATSGASNLTVTEPCGTIEFTVNKAAHEALPGDLRTIVATAAEAENDWMRTEFAARNGQALKTLVEQHGVMLRRFPDSVLAAMAEAKRAVFADITEADADARRMLESVSAFMDTMVPWTDVAERGFLDVRALGA